MENQKKKTILNIIILSILIIILIYITIKYAPAITKLISNPEKFRAFLLSYGNVSVLVFIFFQIFQVVIAFIPGELIQITGGYVYGPFWGTLYSSFGILLGSIIILQVVRILGYSIIKLFVSEQSLQKFNFLMNNKKSEAAMFILFLIPGLPKDILTYIAGITPIKPFKFYLIATIARIPGIFISSFVGANLHLKQYSIVIISSVFAVIILIISALLKDKLINILRHNINEVK